MKHKKTVITLLIILAILLLCGGGIWAYFYYSADTIKPEVPKNVGTTVLYKDGKLNRGALNDDYKNKLFPDIMVPVEGTAFEVVENDRNQEGIVNYMTTLQTDVANLNLTMFSDNSGRTAGAICFEKDDYQDIGNGWSREKLKSQTGVQIGYYYLKNPNYVNPDEDQFSFIYSKYKQFKEDNKQIALDKDKIISCDYVQRVNETKTIISQNNPSDKVFLRIMVDSVPQAQELTQLDKIIIKTQI